MAFFEWNDSFLTGNAEIDHQHKVLIDHVNKLYDAMMEGKGKEQLGKTLAALADYVNYHFKTEESLFETIAYPQKQHHLQEHRVLGEQVLKLTELFKTGRGFLSTETLHTLTAWVQNHILTEDMTYKGLL